MTVVQVIGAIGLAFDLFILYAVFRLLADRRSMWK